MTDTSTNSLNVLGGVLAILGAAAFLILDSSIAAAVLFVLSALAFLQAMRQGKRR